MKFYAPLLAMICLPVIAQAYTVFETDISQPYEIVPIEAAPPVQQNYLGTLDNFPIMYEQSSEEPFTFAAQVLQPANADMQPITLLLIRTNDRGGGVTEVTRMVASPSDWVTRKDNKLGMTFAASPVISEQVEAGTYRLEVSSPDNHGQFLLTIGQEVTAPGYFAELSAIRQTQAYFGYGIFSMVKSAYIYYPLGIALLLFAFFKTWQYRHLIKRPNA